METKWIFSNGDPVQNYLKRHGFNSKKEIDAYLKFNDSQLRTDYKDLDKVVSAIKNAIETNKHICVYGDYDCDGITATSIIILALRNIGYEANYFINDRFKEGYGMNTKGVERMLKSYPDTDFVITCDNGIAAQDGIRDAQSHGIEVVCTDHHLQKGELIVPTVDEWRDDESEELRECSCGAEIARRVMKTLYEQMDEDTDYIDELIVLSGIATVCDVVKFTAANHFIVKRCLELLNKDKQTLKIITLIKDLMGLEEIDEDTLGYKIGPMMNAMSRVNGSPNEMVEILTTRSNSLRAYQMVKEAIAINEERKNLSDEDYELAKGQIGEDDTCIILAGPFHPGIAGLVCSSAVEDYNKPCICLCENGDVLKGSARTYSSFHLKNALDKCADLLETYGGHAGAAGLSLKKENLEAFKERMNMLVKESGVLDEIPEIQIDYVCSVGNLFDSTIQEFMQLAPFGEGFEKPRIVYAGELGRIDFIPKDRDPKHVSFELAEGKEKTKAVWWNSIDRWDAKELNAKDSVRVLGYPNISCYNGRYYRKLYVEDIKKES